MEGEMEVGIRNETDLGLEARWDVMGDEMEYGME